MSVWLSEICHGVWTEHDPRKRDTEHEIIGMPADGNNYCTGVGLSATILYIFMGIPT